MQCRVPPPLSLTLQTVSPLHQNSFFFHSSECCQGADGMQHPRLVFSSKPLLVRDPLHLYNQDEPKRYIQHVRSDPFSSIGDWASRFQHRWGQGARPCFGPMGRITWSFRSGLFSTLYAEYLEYNWFCFLLFVLYSLLIVILVLTLLFCVWCRQGEERSPCGLGGKGLFRSS